MIGDFILNTVVPWVISFVQNNPTIAPLLIILVVVQGVLRTCFKPLMLLISQFVSSTPTPADDTWWTNIQSTKWYKAIIWFVDWFTSIKLPGSK